jgi:beta-fructofuranosidase
VTTSEIRPRVHLTPEAGWLNDPHGLHFIDGAYHLFFQHVPDSTDWRRDISWGHAVSTDLLHWETQPVALAPGDGDEGCWSGCAVIDDDGRPVIFYTSVGEPDPDLGRVRLARRNGAGSSWAKGKVVVETAEPGTRVFRDPTVFRDGDGWRMVVGSGLTDGTACAQVFSSSDLDNWRYDGLLHTRSVRATHPWTGSAWECPQLLRAVPSGDTSASDVLLVSIWDEHAPHDVAAASGRYAEGRFEQANWRLIAAGQGHFAATAFTDQDGRNCVFFWIRGITNNGIWAGAISVPYVITAEDGDVRLAPHPALEAARVESSNTPGTALDIEWTTGANGELSLVGTDGRARAMLELAHGRLRITVTGGAAPVEVGHEAPTLRVLVDAQVLEVVADGGLVGLPLGDLDGGLEPRAEAPGSVAWWHLT